MVKVKQDFLSSDTDVANERVNNSPENLDCVRKNIEEGQDDSRRKMLDSIERHMEYEDYVPSLADENHRIASPVSVSSSPSLASIAS